VRNIRTLAVFLAYFALVYLVASTTIYRFKNPAMTETELFLNIPKALTWGHAAKEASRD
jgi:hypothetical protein